MPLPLLASLVCLIPLLTGALLLLTSERLRRVAGGLGVGAMLAALGLATVVLTRQWNQPALGTEWRWFGVGEVVFSAGIWLDNFSVVLLALVPLVALPVQVFAAKYLRGEARYATFFGLLNLFVAAMLGLVLARDLLAAVLCWELVGFSSFLLIGFWFEKPEAVRAARQAFLLNRLGDLGLFAALGALLAAAGSLDLPHLTGHAAALLASQPLLLTIAGAGLLLGAVAKSAQWPLTPWLPQAMEGPTPVSALLHAATLVAAGAYLLARVYPLLTPDVRAFVAAIGAVTSVWAAVAALGQTDLKRVLAYSTASQLGYVFIGLGTGAPVAAALHLVAHAFFKASLFLNAGIVTHAVAHAAHEPVFDPQDMTRLGGLRRALPGTFGAYALAAAALVGLPFTTGFLTKEAILGGAAAWAAGHGAGLHPAWLVPDAALLTVLLTAFYMARHARLIFLGAARGPFDLQHVRESASREAPLLLLVPVVALAALAVFGWLSPDPLHADAGWLARGFRATFGGAVTESGWLLPIGSVALVLTGLTLGLRGVGPMEGWPWTRRPEALLGRFWTAIAPRAVLRTAEAVARFDEYGIDRQVIRFGKSLVVVAKLTGWFDRWVVDRGVIHGTARLVAGLGRAVRSSQSGQVQGYYRWVVAGALAVLAWVLVR